MSEIKQICETCRWYLRATSYSGECHRYPPSTQGAFRQINNARNWCGEWAPCSLTQKDIEQEEIDNTLIYKPESLIQEDIDIRSRADKAIKRTVKGNIRSYKQR